MSMTARRSVPCWSRLRARLRRLPAMGRTIGTMSTVWSASVIRMRRSLCPAAAFERGAKRNGRDRADQARPASAADRRPRSHGLAAGIWLQLACLGGGRYRSLQASDRWRAALTDRRPADDRGNHCCRLAEPHARAWAAGVRSPRVRCRCGGRLRPAVDPCNKAARGRMGWQRASGYSWRALVEADIGRYKRVIGDALLSRTEGRQMTEVAIAIATLNRMPELGGRS